MPKNCSSEPKALAAALSRARCGGAGDLLFDLVVGDEVHVDGVGLLTDTVDAPGALMSRMIAQGRS